MSARLLAVVIAVWIGACGVCQAAAAPKTARTSTPKARATGAATPSPGSVRILGSEELRFVGEPISLDLKDADIRDVLLTFAKLARMNMVIDPEVKGTVTVRLENVPWDQALEVILRSNGLGYVMEGNVTRVRQPGRL